MYPHKNTTYNILFIATNYINKEKIGKFLKFVSKIYLFKVCYFQKIIISPT